MNFRGATMTPLCSRTADLIGPVPKGRWRLSWPNRRYGRNLGSLIRTKLEALIKWMDASRFSTSKESASYTMWWEGDVHSGIWHWWGNTAPRCTSRQTVNAAYYCTFLQHHLRPALRRKDDIWWYRTPSFVMTIQRVTPLLLSWTSCATGNGRFWNIHRTHSIWCHPITISSP